MAARATAVTATARAATGTSSDKLISPGCGTTPIWSTTSRDGVMDAGDEDRHVARTVTEAGGDLRVDFPATAPASTRAGYRQAATVDFTGTCAIAELVQVPTSTAAAFAYLRIGAPAKNIEIFVEGGQLIGRASTVELRTIVWRRTIQSRTASCGSAAPAAPTTCWRPVHRSRSSPRRQGVVAVDPTPSLLEIGIVGRGCGGGHRRRLGPVREPDVPRPVAANNPPAAIRN